MSPQYTAAFFDMGETLYTYQGLPLSWKDHYYEAWKNALVRNGYSPTTEELKKLQDHMSLFNTREVPRDIEYDSEHIITGALESIGYELRSVGRITNAFFNHFRQTLTPYEETVATLNTLKERNIFIGALTDVAYGMPKHFITDDLRQVGILDLIDCWKTSVDVGYRKPNSAGFKALCAKANCQPNSAIYVGNERKDVTGANEAGLVSVLIHRPETEAPDWGQVYTIHSLSECVSIFE